MEKRQATDNDEDGTEGQLLYLGYRIREIRISMKTIPSFSDEVEKRQVTDNDEDGTEGQLLNCVTG